MTTTDERSFTTPDGTSLALYWQGERDAPVTIVLVHGWVLDSRTWNPVADALSSGPRARPVLRYDLRGHGQSDPAQPATETIAQAADDLADLLCTEVKGPVVLAGHSMGGMAVMALAQRHPELVAQRVARSGVHRDVVRRHGAAQPGPATRVGPNGGPRGNRAEALGLGVPVVAASRAGHQMDRVDPAWGALAAVRCTSAASRCHALRDVLGAGSAANLVTFRSTLDEHDQVAALAAFRQIPVLVLGAMSDRLTPIRHTGKIAAELPQATLVRYAGAGHLVTLERAEQLADRIEELVCSVESGQRLPAE